MLRGTGWTFGIVTYYVEAALVKGVLAEEMDRGKIEGPIAGCTAARLEYNGLGTQLFKLLHLRLSFRAITRYQAAILKM